MSDYANAVRQTYVLEAATLSAAAELGALSGPYGKQGRIDSISVLVTTTTTVADCVVSVNNVGDTVEYSAVTVPFDVAGTVANNSSKTTDDNLIPADTAITIDTDGGCTAGAGTIVVVVAWF